MTTTAIIALIVSLAPTYHVDPKVALAVAAIESAFNPKAIGQAGEVGLYQIMPGVAKKKGWSKAYLLNPKNNIKAGLSMIRDAQNTCVHKDGINYLVCYNYGATNAKRVKHPSKFPYVQKAKRAIASLECHVKQEENK